MRNEKDYLNYYNDFENIQDFVKVFPKNDDTKMVFVFSDNNLCLYEINY